MQIMKKFHAALLMLCAFALSGALNTLSAQTSTAEQVTVTETEVFNPHFFLQLQAGGGYTVGEASKFDKLLSPAAALNFGYRFSPLFGLRIGASGWQARGTWVSPRHDYKFNYIQGSVDAMLSLSNLFCGSNPARTLDFYGFLGVGGACGFHNNEAVELADAGIPFQKLWRGKKLFPAGRGGLGVDINLSRTFAINVEVNANILPDRFNSKRGNNADWQFNGLIGITYNFGGRSKKIVTKTIEVVAEEPVPAPAPAPAPQPKPAPAPQPVKQVEPTPMTQDIFFTINSSTVSTEEKAKVEALINYLKEYPSTTVNITGYADKATGTAPYNMKISKARANKVAEMLKLAGIDASRITVEALGDTEQPFTIVAKNRVAIAITK